MRIYIAIYLILYPVFHPFMGRDASFTFSGVAREQNVEQIRAENNNKSGRGQTETLSATIDIAIPDEKHTKNLPQTDEKRGNVRGNTVIARKRRPTPPSVPKLNTDMIVSMLRRFEGWSITVSGPKEDAETAKGEKSKLQRSQLAVQRCHSLGSAVSPN